MKKSLLFRTTFHQRYALGLINLYRFSQLAVSAIPILVWSFQLWNTSIEPPHYSLVLSLYPSLWMMENLQITHIFHPTFSVSKNEIDLRRKLSVRPVHCTLNCKYWLVVSFDFDWCVPKTVELKRTLIDVMLSLMDHDVLEIAILTRKIWQQSTIQGRSYFITTVEFNVFQV